MRKLLRVFLIILADALMVVLMIAPAQEAFASGSIWKIAPSPNRSILPISNNALYGVASITSSDIWTVGYYNGNTLTEHWNGSKWSLVSSPNGMSGSSLSAVSAVSSTDVWAVGIQDTNGSANNNRTLIEHWNGSKWSVIASPNASSQGDELYGVAAISASDVWAVGSFLDDTQSQILPLLEHWNGTQWSIAQDPPVNVGANFIQSVTAVSSNDVWAVGSASNIRDNENLIMHFDGKQWSILPTVPVRSDGNMLQGVTAVSSTDVWAVGRINVNRGENSSNLALHWNGQSWSEVATPNSGTLTNMLEGVTAFSSSDVWAVGLAEQPPSFANQTLIEHWNGKTWSIVASPNKDPQKGNSNTLFAVTAVSPNVVMAVGTWDSLQQGNPGFRTLTLLTMQG